MDGDDGEKSSYKPVRSGLNGPLFQLSVGGGCGMMLYGDCVFFGLSR